MNWWMVLLGVVLLFPALYVILGLGYLFAYWLAANNYLEEILACLGVVLLLVVTIAGVVILLSEFGVLT